MKYIKYFKEELEEDYSDYKTSIIALTYNGKILILQRGSTAPWMPNKWSLVGGVVDNGEKPKTAVIRECLEEIGLQPSKVSFIEMIETKDVGKIYFHTGILNSDKVQLDYENSDFAFISKEDIDKYEYVPYIKEFIKRIL